MSIVLNDAPLSRYVALKTKDHIRKTAQEMGTIPMRSHARFAAAVATRLEFLSLISPIRLYLPAARDRAYALSHSVFADHHRRG